MRFNPFRRGGGPRLNNQMGQMAAPFQLPPQGQLDIPLEELLGGLSEDAGPPPELDADQNRQLVALLQAVAPSSVRDAVLTTPAQAKSRQPMLTPEEEALTSRQGRLNAMGGPIPSRRPAAGRDLSGGALANVSPDDLRRLLAARSMIEGLAAATPTVTGLPLEFGGALLGGTAAGLGRISPALGTTAGAARARGGIDILRQLMASGGNQAQLRRMAGSLGRKAGY